MTALFNPLLFRAEDGEVLFQGSPISDEAARVVRDVLRTAALDLTKSDEAANVLWSMCDQIRTAMAGAIHHSIQAAERKVIAFPSTRPTETPPSAA